MYKKTRSFLSLVHQLLAYASLILFFSCFFTQYEPRPVFLVLLIPVLVYWLLLPHLVGMWELFLLGLVTMLLPIPLFTVTLERVFAEAVLVCVFFINFLESRSTDRKRLFSDPSIFCLVLYLVLAFFNIEIHEGSLLTWYVIVFAVEIGIYLLYLFLFNMADFIEMNKDNATIPIRQMQQVDQGMIIAFLGLLFAIVVVIGISRIDRYLAMIPAALWAGIRHLLGFINLSAEEPEETEELVEETAAAEIAAGTEANSYAALEVLFNVIFAAVLALLVIAIVIALVRLLRTRLRYGDDTNDSKEFVFSNEQDERAKARRKKKEDELSWHDFSPSGQVRRHYVRTILRARKKKQQLRSSHTPSELEKSVNIDEAPETKPLHDIYEKARYSKDGCTKEESDSATSGK